MTAVMDAGTWGPSWTDRFLSLTLIGCDRPAWSPGADGPGPTDGSWTDRQVLDRQTGPGLTVLVPDRSVLAVLSFLWLSTDNHSGRGTRDDVLAGRLSPVFTSVLGGGSTRDSSSC